MFPTPGIAMWGVYTVYTVHTVPHFQTQPMCHMLLFYWAWLEQNSEHG